MTYFEFQELLTGVGSTIMTVQAMFITGLSAFLVMTHFIGNKLSKLEAITISIVFPSFSGLQIFGTVNQFVRVIRISNYYREGNLLEGTNISELGVQLYGLLFIYVACWAVGIAYMIKVQRSKPT